jgi:hypothetical protein
MTSLALKMETLTFVEMLENLHGSMPRISKSRSHNPSAKTNGQVALLWVHYIGSYENNSPFVTFEYTSSSPLCSTRSSLSEGQYRPWLHLHHVFWVFAYQKCKYRLQLLIPRTTLFLLCSIKRSSARFIYNSLDM